MYNLKCCKQLSHDFCYFTAIQCVVVKRTNAFILVFLLLNVVVVNC